MANYNLYHRQPQQAPPDSESGVAAKRDHQYDDQGEQRIHPAENQYHQEELASPSRGRYRSCDFCAKRKKKCSGGLPRCRLCIEKKQPYCHYQLRPPTKRKPMKTPSTRRPISRSPLPSGGAAADTSGAVTKATMGTGSKSVAIVPGSAPTKRCRLSPSPATGLVGMQENCFLSDFFGCFGILPLATESTVRNGMVAIMEAIARTRQGKHEYDGFRDDGFGIGGATYDAPAEGLRSCFTATGEKDSNDAWVCREASGSPAKCILWCAIALGALMRGSPVNFVTGYISLAQESLAACVDERSIDMARAYLMMSFLYGVIHDEEKNEEYLSKAMGIVAVLKTDQVSEELGATLLAVEKVWVSKLSGKKGRKGDLSTYCRNVMRLLPMGDLKQQKEICNIFLVADRKLNQAFMEDMRTQGALAYLKKAAEQRRKEKPAIWEFPEQAGDVRVEGGRDEGRLFQGSHLPVNVAPKVAEGCQYGPEPPPSGSATKNFVEQALPELVQLSSKLERSGACAGVGGLLYHGTVAYMKSVQGDQTDSFESLKTGAKVLMRYPGIVRFRPHLVHCTLAGSHYCHQEGIYNALRNVYNANRPSGYKAAPPFEEWTQMRQLCDHILCRSVQVEVDSKGDKRDRKQDPKPSTCTRQEAEKCSSLLPSSSSVPVQHTWAGTMSVPAESSRTSLPTLAADDSVAIKTPPISEVPPEEVPHVLPTGGPGPTMYGGEIASDDFRDLADYMARDAPIPEHVTPPPPAINPVDHGGWQGTSAGQPPSALGVAVRAGDVASDLEALEREPRTDGAETHSTDVELVDLFMGEKGRAWREALEKEEM